MEKTTSKKYYAGIDVGSVSLNCVVINSDRNIVFEFPYQRHFGKTNEAVLDLVGKLFGKFGDRNVRSIAFTGNHGTNTCIDVSISNIGIDLCCN